MAISTIGASALDSGVSQLGKNLIINGAMRVAQRGTSIAGAATNYYTLDRWQFRVGSGSEGERWTTTQEDNGGVSGHEKWLKALVATSGTPAAGDAGYFIQRNEGLNCLSFFDSSGQKQYVISLDLIVHADGASGLSAPFSVPIIAQSNEGTAKQYVTNVSVTAADTWQRKTVIVPALAGGTNDADTTECISIGVGLMTGLSRLATDATWETNANSSGTSNSDNFADATNNYVGFTLVQCEVGSVATDFEHEDYGETLRKCQRYLEIAGGEADAFLAVAQCRTTTAADAVFRFQVKKRAAPTATVTNATSFIVQQAGGGGQAVTALSASIIDPYGCRFDITVAANLVAGNATLLRTNSAAQKITFSAEL